VTAVSSPSGFAAARQNIKRMKLDIKLPPISHEMRLLLKCSRPEGIDADKEVMEALSRNAIDWDLFINLAHRHRLPAIVYSNINKLSDNAFPDKFLQRLKVHYVRNARHAMRLVARLATLVKLFEQEGIAVLPLKGPVLALQVFGDLVLRHAGDLDLLVSPGNVKRATKLLSQAGFRSEDSAANMSPRQHRTFMEIRCHSTHYHPLSGLIVELHWNWFHNPYLFPLRVSDALNDAQNLTIGNEKIPALRIETTLLYLCCHGAKHAWYRLFWLCDVAHLLQQTQSTDWERLLNIAKNLGIQRVLAQGIVLSNLLFGGSLPAPIRIFAENEPAVSDLVQFNLHVIMQRRIHWLPRSLKDHIFKQQYDMKLRPDLRYKLLGCLGGVPTSPNDWPIMNLPDALFPLYYVFRPFLRLRRLWYNDAWTNARRAV
jgi:hypothetical protein